MTPGAALLALALVARVAVPADAPTSRARYVATRAEADRGLALPSHEAWGFSQRARLLPDGSTELTVVSGSVASEPAPRSRPSEVEALLDAAAAVPEDVRLLASELAHGARDPWEISSRILTWVSVNVRHEDEPAHDDSASATLASRTGSCVGRSRLAADLLVVSGVPARTIHGLLARPSNDRPFLLHRFVESWIDGLGWVPSDPGESVHVVDARHVVLTPETPAYDPERQRGLHWRIAEMPPPLAALDRPGLRALVTRERPAELARPPGPAPAPEPAEADEAAGP